MGLWVCLLGRYDLGWCVLICDRGEEVEEGGIRVVFSDSGLLEDVLAGGLVENLVA